MPDPSEAPKRSAAPTVGAALLALVFVGSMVFLATTLVEAGSEGREAIDRYVAAIRGGQSVTAAVAGEEADELAAVLRKSSSLRVTNFQSQADTSCFWVTLGGASDSTPARFVLSHDESETWVAHASIARACECPIDPKEPCALQ